MLDFLRFLVIFLIGNFGNLGEVLIFFSIDKLG